MRAMPGGEAVEPVLIAGAGALGSVVGGLLAARGVPVTLLGRADHLESVRRDGLRIEGLFGDHHVRDLRCVSEAGELRGRFGTVFLTVKSWDTDATAATSCRSRTASATSSEPPRRWAASGYSAPA